MKFNKSGIVKLFCALIPYKPLRKAVRERLIDFNIQAIKDRRSFNRNKPNAGTILIVEANDCHGEVIPGYVHYFLELGFKVDVLMNYMIAKQNPLCRIINQNLRIYTTTHYFCKNFLQNYNIESYSHVLVTSSAYYHKMNSQGQYGNVVQTLGLEKLQNLLVVEHDLCDVERFNEQKLLADNRLIVLGNFSKGVMVNPHRFGDCLKTPKNKKTNFIVIGGIIPKRKNHKLLITAVEELIASGFDNFKITVVGRGKLKDLPKSIRKLIDIKGFLDFPEMFTEMEKADFFLPLLDENNPDHERYITSGVTGSAQLIYGFNKIPVIHEKFASFYGFNDDNSIIYKDKKLAEALKTAIELSDKNYAHRQTNLASLVSDVYQKSLINLKEVLHA